MTPPIQTHAKRDRVLLEQVKTLYQAMGSLLAINLLVSACLVFGFWDVIAHENLILWMSLMLGMIAVRGAIYWRFRQTFDPAQLTLYRRFLIVGSASAGIIWGAGGVLLFSETQFDYQLFLLMALYAMAGGSTFSLSLYLPAYFAYVPATLLPITVKFLSLGGATNTSVGVVTLVYLAALTSFNLRLNRNFSESLELRFENLELIDQLTDQKQEAERANRAKSRFLAAASHDLRQPLYSLELFATVLDELVTQNKARRVIGQVRQSLASLEHLFDKLLDISQLDAGVIVANKHDCPLNELFTTLAQEFDGPAAEKGLQITWPTQTAVAYTDPVLVEQILRNLVANSVRYTDTGRIDVRCEEGPEQFVLSVTDTGIGMPQSALGDVFGEFYQLDNGERDREKGLGLGLSIVQRCAALLGQQVSVQSTPGSGSTFSLALDKARGISPASPVSPPATATPASSGFTREMLVVIIDDERDIREGTRQLLELWGCSVVAEEDAASAIRSLAALERVPSSIVSDFRLRDGQTGLEAVKAIRKCYANDIPALLITGDVTQERLLDIDDIAVQFKPVPSRKLREFLQSASRN